MMEFISNYSGIVAIFVYGLLLALFLRFKPARPEEPEEEEQEEEAVTRSAAERLDLNDEDAVVASLVASIDYREQTHRNVRVVSIREVR